MTDIKSQKFEPLHLFNERQKKRIIQLTDSEESKKIEKAAMLAAAISMLSALIKAVWDDLSLY